MKTPIRLTILVFALGLFVACVTATPASPLVEPPPAYLHSLPLLRLPQRMNTPTPLVPSQATQPRGITAVNNFEPSRRRAACLMANCLMIELIRIPTLPDSPFALRGRISNPRKTILIGPSSIRFSTTPKKTTSGSSLF